ncbi:hypothetical protein RB195_022908 [Necator americanus]|uniref:DUF7083 domain-containing protein n=1 Tax=Necator americanus TaxID=51031 RepID=A0ABR1EH28_NECAM
MVEQMRIQHEEMKTLPTALAPTQRTTVQDVSKNQYDQLSKDVQMFVSDEEVGHTFAYWYKRYGGVIRDSVLLDSKKRDLILMKLDEDAHRKYADDILPKQPPEIDFETTIANLEKLFAPRKTLIRRRYECLRINCPPLTASFVPFRDYANMIKRMVRSPPFHPQSNGQLERFVDTLRRLRREGRRRNLRNFCSAIEGHHVRQRQDIFLRWAPVEDVADVAEGIC